MSKKGKAKAVAEVELIRRDNVRDFLIGKPHRLGGRDGWADRNTIAKAMEFKPANVNHWLMDPGSEGWRAISENTARMLEERLQLPAGCLDLPGMGGNHGRTSQKELSELGDKAIDLVKKAHKKVGLKTNTAAFRRAAKFFYNELKAGRRVTDDSVETAVRLSAKR